MIDKSEYEDQRLMYINLYREAYEKDFQAMRFIIVEDEDTCEEDPEVATALKEGFKFLDINAFGSTDDPGKTLYCVIMAKK